ncbi:MAG: energy transducer TonB [Gammaproteobacteria bacterium]|jgi:protein TonB|tara:strand:+ start:416 stop:1042 length:627 start_codon:yes stop_codon:yes gene_type:complete
MIVDKAIATNIALTFIISIIIFLIIQSLITRDSNLNLENDSKSYLEFIRIRQDDSLEQRTRTLPDKPPQPKRPPQPEIELDDTKPPPIQNLDIDIPDFDVPTDFKGAFLGDISNLGSGTSQLIPLVKVAPRCPPEAALAGINGEVLLNLLVNASGRVEKIRLLRANPPRVFNREATRAVRRWQFKPKTIDGVAVEQQGELKVEFICNV